MAVADINSYALSLEMQLADKVSPTLDAIGERLFYIEQQMATVATRTMGTFTGLSTQLHTTVVGIAKGYDQIRLNSMAVIAPLQQMADLTKMVNKTLADEMDLLKDRMLKSWEEITETLGQKERSITEELKALEKEKKAVDDVGKGFTFWQWQMGQVAQMSKQYLLSLIDIVGHIKQAEEWMDRFHTANFRLYGTQQALVAQAQALTAQYGLFVGDVLDAIEAYMTLGVAREAIERLTVATSQMSRITGVGVKQIAEWDKGLLQIGIRANAVTREHNLLINAMRHFGLETRDVNALINEQAGGARRMALAWGDYAPVIQRAQTLTMVMLRTLRERGGVFEMTREEALAAATALGNLEGQERTQFLAMAEALNRQLGLGADLNTAEGLTLTLGAAAMEQLDQMNRMRAQGIQQEQIRMQIAHALAERYGPQMADHITRMAQQFQRQGLSTAQGVANLRQMMAHLQGMSELDIGRELHDANEQLIIQFKLLKDIVSSVIGVFWSGINEDLVAVLSAVVGWLKDAAAEVTKWYQGLKESNPMLASVVGWVVFLGSALLGLVVIFGIFKAAAWLGAQIGKFFGTIIMHTLSGLAKGLERLSQQKTTMLALSVLMLAAAGSALILAYAVAKIADYGWAGVGVLAALTIAVVGLAIGLAFAGTIAEGAIPGLLALSVAMLAVGVAAYLLAVSVQMIAELGWAGAGALLALVAALAVIAVGLVALSYAAAPVIPIIILLAVAILIVAVAVLVLAVAVKIIVDAFIAFIDCIASISSETMDQLLEVSSGLLVVGLNIMLAGAMLLAGAVMLAAGSAMLVASALVLTAAGAALWLASWPIERGLKALVDSGDMAYRIGIGFMWAGRGLLEGGQMMLASTDVLRQAIGNLAALASVYEAGLNRLEPQVRRLEAIAARIAAALRRAMPALPFAMLGLLSTIRADTIATTRPQNETQATQEANDRRESLAAQHAQTDQLRAMRTVLNDIKAAVEGMGGEGGDNAEIRDLLRRWLPEIASKDNGLGLQANMSNWGV